MRRSDYAPRGNVARLWDEGWLAAHTERDPADPGDIPTAELCLVGPAGTGKTRGALEWLHDQALTHARCRILLAKEYREQLTNSVMVTLRDEVFPEGTLGTANSDAPIRFHSEEQAYIYPNGSRLIVKGLRDSQGIYSQQYDHVFVNEANGIMEADWEQLLRAKRNRRTPLSLLLGDMNPDYELHWLHQRCDHGPTIELATTHADNPTLTPGYLRDLSRMTGERKERLYLGRRVRIVEGSYYGALLAAAQDQGRVRPLPVRPQPVDVAWDFGVADFTALWFMQATAAERWAVDYYEMFGQGLAHYAAVLVRKSGRFGYVYRTFYLPHDAEQRVQAELAETRLEILKRYFPTVRMVVVPRATDIGERIEATRVLLPIAHFDNSKAPEDDPEARNTEQGRQRLIAYRRERDERTGVFGARPKHNEASHAADSLGTYAQGWKEAVAVPPPTTAILFEPR